MGADKEEVEVPQVPGVGEAYRDALTAYTGTQGQLQRAVVGDVDTQRAALMAALGFAPEYNQGLIDLERSLAGEFGDLATSRGMALLGSAASLQPFLAGTEDPQVVAMRGLLGQQIQNDLAAGSSMSPEMIRDVQQGVRAGQTARGMSLGQGPVNAEALMTAMQGQALKAQRQQAAQNFLQMHSQTAPNALSIASGMMGQAQVPQVSPNVYNMMGGMMDMQNQANQAQSQLNYNTAALNSSQQSPFQSFGNLMTSGPLNPGGLF